MVERYRKNSSRNSKYLHPPHNSIFGHLPHGLMNLDPVVCMWEWLIWNGAIQDLAKRLPTFFNIKEIEPLWRRRMIYILVVNL